MKLPKHELNKYHIWLQECIRTRKEWVYYYQIRLRCKMLTSEVYYFMSMKKPFISLLLFIVYLPSNILKFFENLNFSYELKRLEKEIEVMEKELIYVDGLRWNKKENENFKLLK